MKLCKDCKWHQISEDGANGCTFPRRVLVDLVTGAKQPALCTDEREVSRIGIISISPRRLHQEAGDPCGVVGRYWEAKS